MSDTGTYIQFDPSPDSSHNLVISLVHPESRVLEFGCATGYMSAVLKTRLGCTVTGIELNPDAARLAKEHCERVIIGDAEQLDFGKVLGNQSFDAILFADVLEHLREPGGVLRRLGPLLAEGGAIIASIPNIAHGSVRLALLDGEFRYRDWGLLDNTHLRFFTRESIQDLFEQHAYFVTHWLRRRKGIGQTEIPPPSRPVPEALHEWLLRDPEATTYQFIIRAVRAETAEIVQHLRTELAEANAELEGLGKERLQVAVQELAAIIPPDSNFILVDQGKWSGDDLLRDRRAIPFLERDGQYWGPPADDATAIREFERLQLMGPQFMVFAWPGFWWLDHYIGLDQYLRERFRCVLKNERVIVFDLGP